ncbi:MAG: ThuA domain-containing protein [Planctomycetaceae bacterium]|jgi:type 1 glutamine amidotransferase|nr:ThuA domain-containing protein [Planctomycetaceae bacterium]
MRKIFTVIFICLSVLFVSASAGGAEKAARKVLYFSNSAGFEHTTVKSVNGKPSVSDVAITAVCEKAGIAVVCTKDGSVFDGGIGDYDAFIFQTSGELVKGAKGRPEWALTDSGWQKLLAAIRGGKGFVGLHPTTDSNRVGGNLYENSPKEKVTEFTKFIGAEFTVHGPSQETTISVVQPSPFLWLGAKGKSFRMFDEWYVHKNFGDDIRVFAILETAGMRGDMYRRPPCPIVWGRAEGKGRVFYSAFGHYDNYWQDADKITFVLQLMQAAIGDLKTDLTPNIKTITPNASVLKNP